MPSDLAWSTERSVTSSPLRTIPPESGRWKPQRILISVDLPAPLSPSRPSTSPLRRCRLTSRSAVTGPKRLAMCSTRSTSSSAAVGPTTFSAATVRSTTAVPPARALHVHVHAHRQDDGKAGVEQQVVSVHSLQDQAILENPQEEGANQRAYDGTGATC